MSALRSKADTWRVTSMFAKGQNLPNVPTEGQKGTLVFSVRAASPEPKSPRRDRIRDGQNAVRSKCSGSWQISGTMAASEEVYTAPGM